MAWPTTYDDWSAPSGASIRSDLTSRVEQIYTALEQIQHTLGLAPQGASSNVNARLDAIEAAIDALDPTTVIGAAIDAHVDEADPHAGKYGKIVTPTETTGGGKLEVGTSPSASGPDYVAWIDT